MEIIAVLLIKFILSIMYNNTTKKVDNNIKIYITVYSFNVSNADMVFWKYK